MLFHRLRDEFQILARCSNDRNTGTLQRAGANLVLSSASMGANLIPNLPRAANLLLLAEGVTLFPPTVPSSMAGRRIADCAVRSTIMAVENAGERVPNPGPDQVLPPDGTLWLVGTLESEEAFLREFKPELAPVALRRRWKNAFRWEKKTAATKTWRVAPAAREAGPPRDVSQGFRVTHPLRKKPRIRLTPAAVQKTAVLFASRPCGRGGPRR